MSRRRTALPVEVPGQLPMFEVPTPSTCICPRGRTLVSCHPRHCGACDRCTDCGECAGPGCTCDCAREESTR